MFSLIFYINLSYFVQTQIQYYTTQVNIMTFILLQRPSGQCNLWYQYQMPKPTPEICTQAVQTRPSIVLP